MGLEPIPNKRAFPILMLLSLLAPPLYACG